MWKCFEILTRRKILNADQIEETALARVLNIFDLSCLGISASMGIALYVLTGNVARNIAGPSVVLSYMIAAIVSVFAGLCYAEFGSRVPRAGSAYIYSYVCVGEFIAFIIGWNLILEYVIGTASCARGLSLHIDTFVNNSIQDTFREIAPMNFSFLSPYFDFLSFGISILFAAALAFGMKASTTVNNICTVITLTVVAFIVIFGFMKANPDNWNLSVPLNSTYGHGGFFPYGFSGTLQGAVACFYGFIGFDSIAATGEEVKSPQKLIPEAIISTLVVITVAYLGTSTVVTLMVPYYMQNIVSPISCAFSVSGSQWARWIVDIGALFGICTNLIATMFPLPRVIYSMASDGIIFRFLGRVSDKFHTPLVGTLLAGLLIGLMAAVFDINPLFNMMSIATLSAYTIVAASVLILRYSVEEKTEEVLDNFNMASTEETHLLQDRTERKITLMQIFNRKNLLQPTQLSQYLVTVEVFVYILLCVLLGLIIFYCWRDITDDDAQFWPLFGVCLIVFAMLLILLSIASQPVSSTAINFKVPFVPLVPALSILMNICMMIMLDYYTWMRFIVWMALGLIVYGFYGYPNSKREYV